MQPALIVAVVVVLVLLIGAYLWWRRKKGCTTNADCTLPNTCQGGKCLPPPPPEVYSYDVGRYGLTLAQAQSAAQAAGATIATSAQMAAAQGAGAQWCWAGWSLGPDGKTYIATYPMQVTVAGCGSPGVNVFNASPPSGSAFGVNLYGPKPPQAGTAACGAGSGPCYNDWYTVTPPGGAGTAKWSQHS